MNVAIAINETIDREGEEFTDDPRDPGGATKWGVTLKTARGVYGAGYTVEQLRRMTREQAFGVYLHEFVIAPHFDAIVDERVRFIVFDFGVNSGPPTAAKSLQRALGLHDDGVVGPATLAAINGLADSEQLEEIGNAIAVDRALFCARLVQNDVNAFLVKFAALKRAHPDVVRAFFPNRKDELDVAAFNFGWVRRALSDVA